MPRPQNRFRDVEQHSLQVSPLTVFFQVLWKKKNFWWRYEPTTPEEDSARGSLPSAFRIPDTVIWENNIPKAWYHADAKEGIVKKKVESKQIFELFTRDVKGKDEDTVTIVACCYTRVAPATAAAADSGETFSPDPFTCEYFDYRGLNDFLFMTKKNKGNCVLQQFVVPQNEDFNDVVQAIWSPGVVMVNRRQTLASLKDPKVSLSRRAVTFEGPPHLSRTVFCTTRLIATVRACSEEVVSHFHDTDSKNVITRMVLHFKVDQRCRLVLLHCPSVRVVPVGKPAQSYPYVALQMNLPIRSTDPPPWASHEEPPVANEHWLQALSKTSRVRLPGVQPTRRASALLPPPPPPGGSSPSAGAGPAAFSSSASSTAPVALRSRPPTGASAT
eukprot:RCo023729